MSGGLRFIVSTATCGVRSYDFPDEPLTLGEFAGLILPAADIASEAAVAFAGETPSCRGGCDACCRQLVTLAAPEAMLMASVVENLPTDRREALRGSIQQITGQIPDDLRHALRMLGDPAVSLQDHYAAAREWFGQGVPCPFLSHGFCGIYETRFATCREYVVFTPADRCANPFDNTVIPITLRLPFRDALASLTSALAGEPMHLIPIALALEWVGDHKSLDVRRWPAKVLLKRFMPYMEIMLGGIERQ